MKFIEYAYDLTWEDNRIILVEIAEQRIFSMPKPIWISEFKWNLITSAVKQREVAFWVGSGLSTSVGFPSWDAWFRHISQEVRNSGIAPLADLIDLYIEKKDYYAAGDLVSEHWLVPDDIKRATLSDPFLKPLTPNINHNLLAEFENAAFYTTNYDSLLEDAICKVRGRCTHSYGNTSDEFKYFRNNRTGSVLHIHGRANLFSTMVFSRKSLDRVTNDENFDHLMKTSFLNSPVIFVGYGLADPDVQNCFKFVTRTTSTIMPRIWIGPVASGFGEAEFNNLGIIPIFYDDHVKLSELLRALRHEVDESPTSESFLCGSDTGWSRNQLLRLSMYLVGSASGLPVHNTVDLALAAAVFDECPSIKNEQMLTKELVRRFRMPFPTANEISRRFYSRPKEEMAQMGAPKAPLRGKLPESSIRRFARCCADIIRDLDESELGQVAEIAESTVHQIVLSDGIDLSFQFLGETAPNLLEFDKLGECIKTQIGLLGVDTDLSDDVETIVVEIFRTTDPDVREELASISNAAFLINSRFIDEEIYKKASRVASRIIVDSNVLLPLLIPDYPTHDSIKMLLSSARKQGSRIFFVKGMANEILAHQTIAVNKIAEMRDDPMLLEAHLVSSGLLVGNTFLRGYGKRRGRHKNFREYLNNHRILFQSEDAVIRRLNDLGLQLIDETAVSENRYRSIRLHITNDSEVGTKYSEPKKADHDAIQLALLETDGRGLDTVLLSEDKKLFNAVSRFEDGALARSVQNPRLLNHIINLANRSINKESSGLLLSTLSLSLKQSARSMVLDKILEYLNEARSEFAIKEIPDLYAGAVRLIESNIGRTDYPADLGSRTEETKELTREVIGLLEGLKRRSQLRERQHSS